MNGRQTVALAHRRLAIIDLSPTGAQPMVDEARGVAIAFNGEIYNHQDLRRRLFRSGPFRGSSDTETLLRLLAVEGAEGLDDVRGIFAFAFVNLRTGRTWLGRDRYGVKPLYWYQSAERVSFASELKGLLADPAVERRIDRDAVIRTVAHLWTPSPGTLLAGCRKVEPGQVLEIEGGRMTREVIQLQRGLTGPAPTLDRAGFEEAVREALTRAVGRQMLADVPVGAMLSGGVDSTAVVREATAAGKLAMTFTVGDDAVGIEGFVDDLPYGRLAAAAYGAPHEEVPAVHLTGENLSAMTWMADEIHADPAVLLAAALAERAADQGIKVLLSGGGADDVFTGYRRHRMIKMLTPAAPLMPVVGGLAHLVAGRVPSVPPVVRRLGRALSALERDMDSTMLGLFRWISPEWMARLFDLSVEEVRRILEEPLRDDLARCRSTDPLERCLWLEQRFFLGDHNLDYLDKASMAHGVETRVPFLDEDLTLLAAANPRLLMARGRPKAGLLAAVERNLPPAIVTRPKSGFGTALRSRFEHDLDHAANDLLSFKTVDNRGLMEPSAVRALHEQSTGGRVDGTYPLLALMLVESWCRTFIDRVDVSAPSDETW